MELNECHGAKEKLNFSMLGSLARTPAMAIGNSLFDVISIFIIF
jgi:hypothetical protein